jgi:hypothetical protein
MSLNFPTNPTPGQVFISEGVKFVWSGTVWVVPHDGLLFASKGDAESGLRGDRVMSPIRGKEAIAKFSKPPPPVPDFKAECVAWCIFNGGGPTIIKAVGVTAVTRSQNGLFALRLQKPLTQNAYFISGLAVGVTNHPVLAVALLDPFAFDPNLVEIWVGTTGGSGSAAFGVNSPLVHVGIFA